MAMYVDMPPMVDDFDTAEMECEKGPWGERLEGLRDEFHKAHLWMLARQPFFAKMSMAMKWGFSTDVPTACVKADASALFNPEFFDVLSQNERAFVIAHELSHVLALAFDRRGSRDHNLWNKAQDYWINATLLSVGFPMPVDPNDKAIVLFDERFEGMSDEEIYDILEKEDREEREQGKQGEGEGQGGQNPDDPDAWGNPSYRKMGGDVDWGSERKLREETADGTAKRPVKSATEWRNEIVAAVHDAMKNQGNVPAGWQRFAADLSEPMLHWSAILSKYVDSIFQAGRTYSRIGRRTGAVNAILHESGLLDEDDNIVLPGPDDDLGIVTLVFDTSGSVGDKELGEYKSEVVDILKLSGRPVRVMSADAAVHTDQYVDDVEQIQVAGGGGTSCADVWEHLKKDEGDFGPTKAVIYFTDGYMDYGQKPVADYEVVWVMVGKNVSREMPPYGRAIWTDGESRTMQEAALKTAVNSPAQSTTAKTRGI